MTTFIISGFNTIVIWQKKNPAKPASLLIRKIKKKKQLLQQQKKKNFSFSRRRSKRQIFLRPYGCGLEKVDSFPTPLTTNRKNRAKSTEKSRKKVDKIKVFVSTVWMCSEVVTHPKFTLMERRCYRKIEEIDFVAYTVLRFTATNITVWALILAL